MKFNKLLSTNALIGLLALLFAGSPSSPDVVTEAEAMMITPVAISSVCVEPDCSAVAIGLTGFTGLPCPCVPGLTDDAQVTIAFPLIAGGTVNLTTTITTSCESTADFDLVLPGGIDCTGDIQLISIIQDPDDSDGAGTCPQPVPISSLFVSIATKPDADANGPYGPFCLDDPSITLAGSPGPGAWQTGFWTGPGVNDGSVLDSIAIFNPQAAGIGIHEVVYQFTDMTGCFDMDTVMIEVFDSPLAVAGDDEIVCAGTATQLHSAIAGGVLPYTIVWTAQAGSFDDPSAQDPFYTGDASGPDTLVLSVMDANGCTSTDTVVLDVMDEPTPEIGADTTICNNGDLQLAANVNGGQAPYVYSWQTTGGSFSDPSIENPIYVQTVPGSYDITIFVIDANGCQSDSTITVTVNESAVVDLGGNQILCSDSELQLNAATSGGQSPYTYSWTANGGSFDDATIANPIYTNDQPGAYVVELVTAEGSGCETVESIVVTVLDSVVVDLDERILACENSATVIPAAVSGGTPPYTYFWTNTGGSFDDPTVLNPTYNTEGPGLYLIHLEVRDAFGCGGVIGAIVEVAPDYEMELGADINTCTNAPFTISPVITGGNAPFSYSWTASSGSFIDDEAAQGMYLNDVPGTYEVYLQVVDSFGCTQMDTVIATVTEPPFVEAGLDRTICNADPIVLTPSIAAPNTPLTYQWVDNGAGGGFSDATVPNPTYSNTNSGIHTLSITVTDANGCIGTDSLLVTVNQEPFFQNCPDTLVFGNDEDQCGAFVNWPAPVGLDKCNHDVVVEQTFGPEPGTRLEIDSFYQVEYTVTAQAGSGAVATCNFVVIVKDTECPDFITTLPADITLDECDDIPAPFVVIPQWHTSDNCTDSEDIVVDYRQDTTDIICSRSFTLKRFWTATDLEGNSCDYVQKITVSDTSAPVFMINGPDTVSCADLAMIDTTVTGIEENCTPDSLLTVSFIDVTTQGSDSSACDFYSYSIIRRYSVADECGNADTLEQSILVTDDALPMAMCRSIEVFLDTEGNAIVTPAMVDSGSFDACAPMEVLSYRLSQDTFTCANVGENAVILYVTDPCGNEGACVATVTVSDTLMPSLTCPKDWTVSLDPGECGKFLHSEPHFEDNCDVTWVSIPEDGSFIPIGLNEITIIGTDAGGNVIECSYMIDVREYPNPTGSMSCNNRINLSLNENCEATITAAMLLKGGPYGCYDDFEVVVIDEAGDTITEIPHAGIENIGEVFTVSIINPDNENSCWGEVLIEQKLEPTVMCPADTVIPCTHSIDPDLLGRPFVTSCEPSIDIRFVDDVTDFGACGTPRREIIRTWTITDESGNEVTCTQSIRIESFDLDLVEFPHDYTQSNDSALACIDVRNDSTLVLPRNTGFPTLLGETLNPDDHTLCDYTLSYWDKVQEGCGNTFTILRHWQILDVCAPIEDGVNPIDHTQFIHVADTDAPIVTGPDDVTLSTEVFNCASSYAIPDPVVDDCSPVKYSVTSTRGTIIDLNPGFVLIDLEEGETILRYAIEDFCGNIVMHEVVITVIDNIPPTPVCDEFTVVSLTSNGTAYADAITFDDGSHDNCGPVFFKVIKERDLCGTPNGVEFGENLCGECVSLNGDDADTISGTQIYFDDRVDFCCEETGEQLIIIMRVFDMDPGEGPVAPSRMAPGGDLFGRFNDCEIEARVEDKLPPFLACPSNVTVSCDYSYDLEDLSDISDRTFGTVVLDESLRESIIVPGHGNPTYADNHIWGADGFAADNCEVAVDVSISTDISCGQGVISRTFTATDSAGNTTSCTQQIFFESFDPFDEDRIDWPADVTLTDVCVDAVLTDPSVTGEPDFGAGVCSDVLQSFEDEIFVNDPDACVKIFRTWKLIDWCQYDEDTGEGIFTDLQIIKVSNAVAPVIANCTDLTVCDSAATSCESFVELVLEATDDCTQDSDLEYSYAIDLFHLDDADGSDFDADILASAYATIAEGGNDASQSLPYGIHKILWTVRDGCDNITSCEGIIDIQDCKKPSPKCFSGIVTVVMAASGEVEIWASDFDAGSDDNCGDVTASFSPDVTDINRTFTCDDLGSASVNVYFTDAAGNQDFCETFLFIQDNSGVCGSASGDITGEIMTNHDEPLEDAEVRIEGVLGGMERARITGSDGGYAFFAVPHFDDYEITGFKNDDPDNGVTSLDILRIQQHLLGVDPFDNAMQYIAADVNNNEAVSSVDILHMRRLLLGYYTEFPNNTSWRFVDADQTFADFRNPWPLDETILLDDFQDVENRDNDFVAIKIGDLNASASPGGLRSESTDRSSGTLVIMADDYDIKEGDVVSMGLSAKNDIDIVGIQFAISYDPEMIEFLGATAGQVPVVEGSHYFRVRPGLVKFSWSDVNTVSLENLGQMLSINFRSKSTSTLRDIVRLSDKDLNGEIYTYDLTAHDLSLQWRSMDTGEYPFGVEQNTPNPFFSETSVAIQIAETSDVEMTIYDEDARPVHVIAGQYGAGTHMMRISADDLMGSGVYIYEVVATGLGSGTIEKTSRKMILLK